MQHLQRLVVRGRGDGVPNGGPAAAEHKSGVALQTHYLPQTIALRTLGPWLQKGDWQSGLKKATLDKIIIAP